MTGSTAFSKLSSKSITTNDGFIPRRYISRKNSGRPVAPLLFPRFMAISRSLSSASPSSGWIPSRTQAPMSAQTPMRLLRPSSALSRLFGLPLYSATLTPNSLASLSMAARDSGAGSETIVSTFSAFANSNSFRLELSSGPMVAVK